MITLPTITLPVDPAHVPRLIKDLNEAVDEMKKSLKAAEVLVKAIRCYCEHKDTFNDGDPRGSSTYYRTCGASW